MVCPTSCADPLLLCSDFANLHEVLEASCNNIGPLHLRRPHLDSHAFGPKWNSAAKIARFALHAGSSSFPDNTLPGQSEMDDHQIVRIGKSFELSQRNGSEQTKARSRIEYRTRQDIVCSILQQVLSLEEGEILHGYLVASGYQFSTFEANLLMKMYSNFGAVDDARAVFDRMRQHNRASWNAIMSCYNDHGFAKQALDLFADMRQKGLRPDRITLKVILSVCASLAALPDGILAHQYAAEDGVELNIDLGTALIHMYGTCGAVKKALSVFMKMPQNNEITWTAVITVCVKQGYSQTALDLYKRMRECNLQPNKIILRTVISACADLRATEEGKMVQKYICQSSFAYDFELSIALMKLHGKCGEIQEAYCVFKNFCPHSVNAYNAMIECYLLQGHNNMKIIELFVQLKENGLKSDVMTINHLAQACTSMADVTDGFLLYSSLIEDGLDLCSTVGNTLVEMYLKFGATAEAHWILDRLDRPNNVSLNAIVRVYAQQGHLENSIALYKKMQQKGLKATAATIASVLSACSHQVALKEGAMIHSYIVDSELESDAVVGSALINLYGTCGYLEKAHSLFEKIQSNDVVFWTSMIVVYVQHGQPEVALRLFCQMQQLSLVPNKITYVNALNACAKLGALVEGRRIHACTAAFGIEVDAGLGNALINMYGKCEALKDAWLVFSSLVTKNLVSWNVIMGAYNQHGHSEMAIQLFHEMQQQGVEVDEITCTNILSACASLVSLERGRVMHSYVITKGFDYDVAISTALINMYGKCSVMEDAQCVFDRMLEHNIYPWTAIISVHAQQGLSKEAIQLFGKMKSEGLKANNITLVSVLCAYANLGIMADDEVIQACIDCSIESDVLLGNGLINMYGKCGAIQNARSTFDQMHVRNLASWNAMIFVYVLCGYGREALQLVHEIEDSKLSPDELTFLNCLTICASMGALQEGKQFHGSITARGFETHTGLANALINMYGKCGALGEAYSVFRNMQRDVVSWNTILAVYAQEGQIKEATQVFQEMWQENIDPDAITLLGVLKTCSHTGSIKEACELFSSVSHENHTFKVTIAHYGCLIDLFGRIGQLDVAEDLIYTMPMQPTAVGWMTLLGTCRIQNDIERGKRAFTYVTKLDPHNAAPFVLLSNIYAAHQRWEDVQTLRNEMMEKGLQKRPGCSMIEINNTVHSFFAQGRSHPESDAIYHRLKILNRQLEERGYVPDTKQALRNLGEDMKKFMLCHHSERLAMSFGLIKSPPGTPLLIIKNLRMCKDCHCAFKFISVVVGREITLRDSSRLHHFRHGLCSCGDYW